MKLGNPHHRDELGIRRSDAESKSWTELAQRVKPRSWATPEETADPGDWTGPVERMGRMEEEGLWTGPDSLDICMGPTEEKV